MSDNIGEWFNAIYTFVGGRFFYFTGQNQFPLLTNISTP